MSLAADALQPYVAKGLLTLNGRVPEVTLPSVIISPQKAGYDLDLGEGRKVSIDFRQPEFFTVAIASDSSRFMSASFQSLAMIEEEIQKKDTLPWSLIKLYYAAFYAGHALIRLFGESCSHFNHEHVTQINRVATSIGTPPFRIESGLYHCVVSDSAAGLSARLLEGGSHDSFWKVFGGWLKSMTERISRGPLSELETQEVFLKFEALRDAVKDGSLSNVRNNLQYRHEYGVWSPSRLPKRDREALGRLVSQWNRDPMTIDLRVPNMGKLGKFVATCGLIIALCRTMLRRIAERSTARRSFVYFGPLDLLARAGG